MKIALVTDTHAGARNDSLIVHNHFKKFLDDIFFPEIDKNNITSIVHLGDVFDRRKYISFQTLSKIRTDFFEPLHQRGLIVNIIAGNHDIFFKNINDISSLEELLGGQRYPLFTIFKHPTEVLINNSKFLFVPWICDSNREETFKLIKKTNAKIALGHLDLNGFKMYRNNPPSQYGLDRKIFNKFDLVASGHFHHKSSEETIHYLGATHEMKWNDFNDPRGFHILDTETLELKFIENPHRLFRSLVYNDEKTSEIGKQIGKQEDYQYVKDSYIKIVIVKKTNPFLFDQFISMIEKNGPIDITLVENVNLFDDLNSEDEIADQIEDTTTILNNYINGLEVDLDKEKIKEKMQFIYNEAVALSNDGE